MTRARLYVLMDAFERDVRAALVRFVVNEIGEEAALNACFERASVKRAQDGTSGDANPITEYLDMREAYDLLNTHRSLLPSEYASEVRDLTGHLDRLVAIRNRVMHARPLAAGDSDAAVSILTQFQTRYWSEMKRTLAQLVADPSWEPLVTVQSDAGLTLHNLPLPDYDETGLVGRAKEVADLVSLIKRGREPVLTITGEGGIGKTALALEVAYLIADDTSQPFDAVLWTSLKHEKLTANGVRDIAGAARDIVGALQPLGRALDDDFGGSSRELASALEGLRVLIVLDNLETVGGSDFATLYDGLPDTVSYLITSRVGVGEFERRYPLSPLSRADSLRLFNDFVRARRIAGLDRISSDARVQVVTKLRNSPLAIKWFALAVEAGNDPIQLIRHQDELLEFCVRSVYDSLEPSAREVLGALAVLGRPVSVDELVVLLQRSMDQINVGLQELMRGSLVRRENASSPGDLNLRVVLTETATQFLSRRVPPDDTVRRAVLRRETEYRATEERRASDLAERSLAPVVVRSRTDADAPTAQILRQALLAGKAGDLDKAFKQVELARKLNPDFWEVDRVEGYLRGQAGDLTTATACYRRAYEHADGEDRAVVAHFFAGYLARSARDVKSAIAYADEAHETLKKADTAVALGTYLVWAHRFSEGVALIEPASVIQTGKARLIAISSLAEAYRRWAEYARSEERNPLLQFRRAEKGLGIALAALESGVSDNRLRDTGADCAVEAVNGATQSITIGTSIANLSEWLDSLSRGLVRFVTARRWSQLLNEILKLSKTKGCPAAGKRLAELALTIDQQSTAPVSAEASGTGDASMIGEIVSIRENYGFIRHPAFPGNIFFHSDDVNDRDGFDALHTGALVHFRSTSSDRGPRAIAVARS
ncbi:AAA family ATPase [Nostocoides sp. F2B08]|uniref:AAA family ATPase n=1 Tax=Nostocoides sp. F2B08 TaxID=2653936 RepID=UPI0012633D0A|nr:AAA family ATPase [Tetrasphaera sp. F2B08]KAB7740035.1 AAA family ATPase [Tetrasphaera sp. F2B08]